MVIAWVLVVFEEVEKLVFVLAHFGKLVSFESNIQIVVVAFEPVVDIELPVVVDSSGIAVGDKIVQ